LIELKDFRNLLTHSAYSIDGGVTALSYLVSTRKPGRTPITTQVLKEKLYALTAVMDDLTSVMRPSPGDATNAYTRPM
jgi:hypothetical protein